MPPGTPNYWSWLFAARDMRQPLIGIYALMAELRALTEASADAGVAQIKLAWWRDELRRLAAGLPLHPITRFLMELPRTEASMVEHLETSIEAVAAQAAGAPLELAAELESHADALYGVPLRVAARLSGGPDRGELHAATAALAVGQYLARAVADSGRDARAGRIPFAIDELLAAGIGNDDLAGGPSPRLQDYLQQLRVRAADYFSAADRLLPPAERAGSRHLLVLSTLGANHVNGHRNPSSADFHLADLYNAWNAARRAAASR